MTTQLFELRIGLTAGLKMGPGLWGKMTDSPFENLDNIAGVSAVSFLVTFSKNISSKLRLLTRFLRGRTRMCEASRRNRRRPF